MIRFLNLKDQICEGHFDFAFYDTAGDTICSFGEPGEQVFSSIMDFKSAYGKEKEWTTRPLSRFVSLIPKGYFDNNRQMSDVGGSYIRIEIVDHFGTKKVIEVKPYFDNQKLTEIEFLNAIRLLEDEIN